MAQWKSVGLITQRSVDRNHLLLPFWPGGGLQGGWAEAEGGFPSGAPQWRNWIALQTSNLEVVGSNPTWGGTFSPAPSRVGGYGLTARRRIPDPKIGGSNPSSLTFWRPGWAIGLEV